MILSQRQVLTLRNKLPKSKIGFINGCFDVLHIGHIRMFEFAKKKCDYLIVGIDSDTRIKHLKGPHRPINNQKDRHEFLLSLKHIDKVFLFETDTELTSLIKSINPDIMIVGSDYRDKTVIGAQHAKRLIFFDRIAGYSTSKIIEGSGSR